MDWVFGLGVTPLDGIADRIRAKAGRHDAVFLRIGLGHHGDARS